MVRRRLAAGGLALFVPCPLALHSKGVQPNPALAEVSELVLQDGHGRTLDFDEVVDGARRRKYKDLQDFMSAAKDRLRPLVQEVRKAFHLDADGKNVTNMSTMLQAEKSFGGGTTLIPCKAEKDKCSLKAMRPGQTYLVFPSNVQTSCIFGDPYAFQVWPGHRDKLHLFFDGGGACWDEVTTVFKQACQTHPVTSDLMGMFNNCQGEPSNPFRDHTVVFILSCSGDLHAGNRTRSWVNPQNPHVPIQQSGYANVRATLDWVKANMDSKLTSLVIAGESAGALGAQIWARTVLRELQHERAAVISDSYVGVFPAKFQERTFQELHVCGTPLLEGKLKDDCFQGTLTIPDMFDSVMKEFPHVRFATVNSKHDQGQIIFYNLAATTAQVQKMSEFCGGGDPNGCDLSAAPADLVEPSPPLEFDEFHKRMEATVEQLSKNPNYVSYIMTNSMHTVLYFVWGDCMLDYEQIGFEPFGESGTANSAKNSVQRRGLRDFINKLCFTDEPIQSVCEKLSPEDADDWCRPAQEAKALA